MSFVVEIANKYELIASDRVVEVTKSSYASIMYEIMKAVIYPRGVFVLNGNLKFNINK